MSESFFGLFLVAFLKHFIMVFNGRYWPKIFLSSSRHNTSEKRKFGVIANLSEKKKERIMLYFCQSFAKVVFCSVCLFFEAALLSRNHRNVNFKAIRVKYTFLKSYNFADLRATYF